MNWFCRSTTALLASSAIAITPIGATAQTSSEPNAEQLEALRALIAASQGSSEIAEKLRQLDASVAALRAQVETDAAKIDGLVSALATMAQTLVSVEALAKEAESQLAEARSAAEGIKDDTFVGLLDGVGKVVEDAANIADLPVDDALAKMDEVRRAAEALRAEFLRQGEVLQDTLNTVCTEAIPANLRGPLGTIIGGSIPPNWTASIAATAVENGLDLPDCFNTPDENGRSAEQEVMDYLVKRQASQEMANAMNTIMMMAMSTGNPYIIAAAVAIMALMAIFGDSGGGDGDGQGESEGHDYGQPATTGNGTEHKEGEGENQAVPPNTPGPGNTATPPVALPSLPLHPNVREGLDTIVQVQGQIITLVDARTKEEWPFAWPDRFAPMDIEIPDFSNDVFIEAANAVERTITVTLEVPMCRPGTMYTFALKADPNDSTVPILAQESDHTCIQ